MLSQLEMEFAQIKYRWRIHSELFGSDENVDLLNRCGGEVFGLTQKLMIYDTLAALCRLCDPSKSRGNENNSIYNQYEKQKSNLSSSEIKDIESDLSSLEGAMSNIRTLRNKSMSHNDLGVAVSSIKLPNVTYDEIENVLNHIVKILNKVFKVNGNYESVSKFGPGVSKLLKTLKAGEGA